jgi:hypothetical protein
MRQATLVAYYGSKPAALEALIEKCQHIVEARAGGRFHPYGMEQVHATILGLERVDGNFNRNFAEHRGERKEMDVVGFSEYLQKHGGVPFEVQFGGFPDSDFPFTSRGKRPFARSFSIQGDKAVLIGWPVRRDPPPAYPATLDELRRRGGVHGILHSWHRNPEDYDNDLYLRLGLFGEPVEQDLIRMIEYEVRNMLSANEPVFSAVDAASLRVVSYLDETLPPATSVSSPIGEIRARDCFDSLLAGVPPPKAETAGRLVLATTPRRDSLAGIEGFLKFGRAWQAVDERVLLLVAMPSRCSEEIREALSAMLLPGKGEHLAEMSPAAGALVGTIFKGAAEAAFQLPGVRAFLHIPVDIDFGNLHPDDVQLHIRELARIADGDGPALLLGDYEPRLWRRGMPARHWTKELIGKTIWGLFRHFGLDTGLLESEFRNLRTEFWSCKSYFFKSADEAGAFSANDPIPFLILHANQQGLPVETRDIGTFYEAVEGKPDASRVLWQVIRFAEQAANAYLARRSVRDLAAARSMLPAWKNKVEEGMRIAFENVDEILRKLGELEEAK